MESIDVDGINRWGLMESIDVDGINRWGLMESIDVILYFGGDTGNLFYDDTG
jgi:hypothetical protein